MLVLPKPGRAGGRRAGTWARPHLAPARRSTSQTQEAGALPTANTEDLRMTHGTEPALPCASRHGRSGARVGQRVHVVQSLPVLLRLWASAGGSTSLGLLQHKTHLGRILFPPRVITGPAKSHLLFAATGLTALLLVQFDGDLGFFTGFDGRGGAFPPICAQGKEALGATTEGTVPPPQGTAGTNLQQPAGRTRRPL